MNVRMTWPVVTLTTLVLSGVAMAQTAQQTSPATPGTSVPVANADADMTRVLDALAAMHPKPIAKLTAAEARQQPSAADAANQVLREQGKSTLPDPSVMTKNILVDGAKGKIVATVFKPANATTVLPVIVYYHGGGFVIANNSTYAASCEVLAKNVPAVVVEVEYSKAPEHKFPASHDDAVAA